MIERKRKTENKWKREKGKIYKQRKYWEKEERNFTRTRLFLVHVMYQLRKSFALPAWMVIQVSGSDNFQFFY